MHELAERPCLPQKKNCASDQNADEVVVRIAQAQCNPPQRDQQAQDDSRLNESETQSEQTISKAHRRAFPASPLGAGASCTADVRGAPRNCTCSATTTLRSSFVPPGGV